MNNASGIRSNSDATKSGVVGVASIKESHKTSASIIQQPAPGHAVLDGQLAPPVASARRNESPRASGATLDVRQLDEEA